MFQYMLIRVPGKNAKRIDWKSMVKGGDFMKRLPLVMALVLAFVFSVSVHAVPYPYGEYTLKT